MQQISTKSQIFKNILDWIELDFVLSNFDNSLNFDFGLGRPQSKKIHRKGNLGRQLQNAVLILIYVQLKEFSNVRQIIEFGPIGFLGETIN